MADVTFRLLDEEDWSVYREVRLAALKDAPDAFVARFEDEASYDEAFWRERMVRASRFVAEREGKSVGLVCLGPHDDGDPETGEVFGLWTVPTLRGQHVARGLVSAAARKAADEGLRLLYFWVVSDNALAIGFASTFGFRPTSQRRPVRVAHGSAEHDADEVAMVLSLVPDPTQPVNSFEGDWQSGPGRAQGMA